MAEFCHVLRHVVGSCLIEASVLNETGTAINEGTNASEVLDKQKTFLRNRSLLSSSTLRAFDLFGSRSKVCGPLCFPISVTRLQIQSHTLDNIFPYELGLQITEKYLPLTWPAS